MTLTIPSVSVVPLLPFGCKPAATQARDTYPCSRPKRRESCEYERFWCRGRAGEASFTCSRESPSRDGMILWTRGLRWIREAHIKPLLYSERTQFSVLTIHQLGFESKTADEVKNDSRATREAQGPGIVSLPMLWSLWETHIRPMANIPITRSLRLKGMCRPYKVGIGRRIINTLISKL